VDVHTYTQPPGVAGLLALVHTPEVDQSECPDPPHLGAPALWAWRAGVQPPALCFFTERFER